MVCLLRWIPRGGWKERLGGVLTVGGLFGFYLWMLLAGSGFPLGPWLALFSSPGLLMGIVAILDPPHSVGRTVS